MRTELAIAITAGTLGLLALIWAWSLSRRLSAVLKGSDGASLESTLTSHIKQVEGVGQKLAELTDKHHRLAQSSSLASQKISIVRFNPFGDTGGDQSFTLAVLDSHDSGYVLTSIHGREGTRVYVKPVDNGKSKYTLSNEEKQALLQAAKRVVSNG